MINEDRTNCNPFTMTPTEFNQFVIDYACGNVHSKCMTHCLDDDQTEYNVWNDLREQLLAVCNASAQGAATFQAHVNRFNTHIMPLRVLIERKRAARSSAPDHGVM